MFWGASTASGKADLVVMEGKQNCTRYINVLGKSIVPFMNHLDINNDIFQQDNAAIHTSKLMKNWFKTKKKILHKMGCQVDVMFSYHLHRHELIRNLNSL